MNIDTDIDQYGDTDNKIDIDIHGRDVHIDIDTRHKTYTYMRRHFSSRFL